MLTYIVERSKQLHYLSLGFGFTDASLAKTAQLGHNLKTLIVQVDCRMTVATVTSLLHSCNKLERAEFHHIAISMDLRRLDIPQWQISSKALNALVLGVSNPRDSSDLDLVRFS